MDTEKMIIAVISAATGGLIKYLIDSVNERRKDKKDTLAKLKEQHKDRPEFVITNMEDYFNRPGVGIKDLSCDM